MSSETAVTSDDFGDLQIEYARLKTAVGASVARSEVLAKHPDRAKELRQFFGDEDNALGGKMLGVLDLKPTTAQDVTPGVNAGQIIGERYRLLEEIGVGGMGTVWVASQSEPVKRRVAIKLIKAGMDSKAVLARFEQERQALAVMDHPNIAKVFDGGLTPTGRPFFAMELVAGKPLNKFCDEAKLSIRERLELFTPICHAVQHAHQKGIIHRDLKPANILVTFVDGRPTPKIIDFGVAKAVSGKLSDETLFTQFGAMLGTVEYMAPEQAGMTTDDIDTRADIYSLGVIFYEVLTGLRPFDSLRFRQAAFDEVVRILREEDPPSLASRLSTDESLASAAALRQMEPHRLLSTIKNELDWIVHKCLEKDRNRRYETANDLARDLQRYLANEPVEARPISVVYRFRKFVRRNRFGLAVGVAVASLLIGATVLSLDQAARARRAEAVINEALKQVTGEQNKTRDALGRETAARNDALDRLRESQFLQAHAHRLSGRPGRRLDSLAALKKAVAIDSTNGPSPLTLRNEAIAALALTDLSSQPIWQADLPNNDALAIHPDFQHYATWSREEGSIYVRRCSDQSEAARFAVLKDSIWPVIFSPDGRYLACGSVGDISNNPADGKRLRVDVWDWQTRTSVFTNTAAATSSIALLFSPDSTRLVVSGSVEPKTGIHDLLGKSKVLPVPMAGVPVAFHPDGSKIAMTDGNRLTVFDIVAGRAVAKPLIAPATIFAANWSPDRQWLAIGCDNFRSYLHDAMTGELRSQLSGHQAEVHNVQFSPDSSLLVSSDWDGVTRLWDTRTGRRILDARGRALGFSRDGGQLCCVNGTRAGIWTVAIGNEYRELWGHTCFKGPGGVRWGLDGTFIASSGDDATRLWDPATGKQLGLLPVGGNTLRLQANGANWFSAGTSGFYRWPIEAIEPAGRLRIGPPEKLYDATSSVHNGIELSADGQWLAVHDRTRGMVIVRSPTDTTKQKSFAGFTELVGTAISPDNRWLVVGGWPHNFLHVYDLATEQCVHKVPLISSAFFAFSPDGKWLAVGNAEGGRLLEAGSWTRQREIPPRNGSRAVGAMTFTRDGGVLAVGRADHVVQFLDVATLTEFAAFESPTPAPVKYIEFSPGNDKLAVACGTRVVHVWNLRAIRGGLAALGLDWKAPPYPEPPRSAVPAPSFEINSTGLVDTRETATTRRGLELNNQAWPLLTGPPKQRDAAKGLSLIREAIKLRPNDTALLNTLGVALYRNANYREAIAALERSRTAGKSQWDGFDLYFLAMSHARLGDKAKARDSFQQAVRWVEQQKQLLPDHLAELKQFRAEAERELEGK